MRFVRNSITTMLVAFALIFGIGASANAKPTLPSSDGPTAANTYHDATSPNTVLLSSSKASTASVSSATHYRSTVSGRVWDGTGTVGSCRIDIYWERAVVNGHWAVSIEAQHLTGWTNNPSIANWYTSFWDLPANSYYYDYGQSWGRGYTYTPWIGPFPLMWHWSDAVNPLMVWNNLIAYEAPGHLDGTYCGGFNSYFW